MGKQINSAKKMESSSKNSSNSVAMKDSKKINDYFSLGNRKRNRDESEKSKSQSILKPHTKDNNQINSISLVSSERNSESKGIKLTLIYLCNKNDLNFFSLSFI